MDTSGGDVYGIVLLKISQVRNDPKLQLRSNNTSIRDTLNKQKVREHINCKDDNIQKEEVVIFC